MYEDLVEYKALLDSGTLSPEEFDKLKARILGIKLPAKAAPAPKTGELSQQTEEALAVDAVKSTVEEIMEYKTLLDSGAISQSEFNRKKAQLLGVESDEDRALREKAEAARIEREGLLAEQEAEAAREKAKREADAKRKRKSTLSLVLKCVCAFVVITALGFVIGILSGSIYFTEIALLISLPASVIAIVVLVVMHKRRTKRKEQGGAR